jgi:hypothetical protein
MGVGLGFLIEAEAVVEQLGDAGIDDLVVHVIAVATGVQDPKIHQATELVGDRLGLHAHGRGQIAHAGVALAEKGVEEA